MNCGEQNMKNDFLSLKSVFASMTQGDTRGRFYCVISYLFKVYKNSLR